MKTKIGFLKTVLLLIVIVSSLFFGLAGCVDIVIPPTSGIVKLVVSGNYEYNLKMDGTTYFFDEQEGTYTISDVPVGNHTFEAIDTWGSSYGYDSLTEYISTGINFIYLDPEPSITTGTVYLVVSGNWEYDLKMDGTTYFYDKSEGTYTIPDVEVGNHTFEAIDTMGASWGYDSDTKYINTGSNYVYLYP